MGYTYVFGALACLAMGCSVWSAEPPDREAAAAAEPPELATQVAMQVSPERVMKVVEKLASFGTRHSLSDTESATRGIGAARRWLKAELGGYVRPKDADKKNDGLFQMPGTAQDPESFMREMAKQPVEALLALRPASPIKVEFEELDVPKSTRLPDGGKMVNVVAVLPGLAEGAPAKSEAKGRRYYVVGHYDSRNGDPMNVKDDAPGANDDASGVAVVLECARVLADKPLRSTIVFLCTSGEEQGLFGAALHAAGAAGRHENIMGVLSNDIVGDPTSGPDGADTKHMVRLFSEGLPRNPSTETLAKMRLVSSEGDSPSRELARFVRETALWHKLPVQPVLIFRPDRFLRGGDHSAFNENGFAAVRFTVPFEVYDRQHADIKEKDGKPYGDVPAFVDGEYLANVARVNAAALVHLANAPSPPTNVRIVTAKLDNDTTLRWKASPEGYTAGYELVWRATTSAEWEHVKTVGNVTEVTVPTSKDDNFFGVRAYSNDGYRSPVTFAGAAKE